MSKKVGLVGGAGLIGSVGFFSLAHVILGFSCKYFLNHFNRLYKKLVMVFSLIPTFFLLNGTHTRGRPSKTTSPSTIHQFQTQCALLDDTRPFRIQSSLKKKNIAALA